jgi:hypothetical protein
MKTPYCTALRIQRRDVDRIRIAISVAIDESDRLDRHGLEMARRVADEHACAVSDGLLPANGYFTRMKLERARIARERALADARLDQLRDKARDSYGAMKAVETAADAFRDGEARRLEAAEQASADDRAALDMLAALRRLRASNGRTG